MITPFSLGQVMATPGALKLLEEVGEDPLYLLARHRSRDWGELDEHDRQENELSLRHGWWLLSSYPVEIGRSGSSPRQPGPTPPFSYLKSTDELLLLRWGR